jgi:hypothetical protein
MRDCWVARLCRKKSWRPNRKKMKQKDFGDAGPSAGPGVLIVDCHIDRQLSGLEDKAAVRRALAALREHEFTVRHIGEATAREFRGPAKSEFASSKISGDQAEGVDSIEYLNVLQSLMDECLNRVGGTPRQGRGKGAGR